MAEPLVCAPAIRCSQAACCCMPLVTSSFACPNALHLSLSTDQGLEIESRGYSGDTPGDMWRICMNLDNRRGNLPPVVEHICRTGELNWVMAVLPEVADAVHC